MQFYGCENYVYSDNIVMEHCDNNTNQNTNSQSPDSISQCSCPGLAVLFLRERKMNINERTIGIVKYCRKNGYKKTLDILWFEYNHKLITSKTFDSIVKVLKTKRMHINY